MKRRKQKFPNSLPMTLNSFDPLAEWLGIPAAEQPPHHYRLLGLATFESDAATIERAADERMALIRKHQTGPRAAATQDILNRLAAAKQCLLNPATRGAYDGAIRGQLAAAKSTAGTSTKPRNVDAPPTFDVEVPPVETASDFGIDVTAAGPNAAKAAKDAKVSKTPRRKGGRPLLIFSIALSVFTACAGGWVLWKRYNDPPDKEPAPVVIVKRVPAPNSSARKDEPPMVRPDGGVLRCIAENVSLADAHRRGGDLLDLTIVESRVEISWTVRVRKAGFYVPTITYSAAGEGTQTFEIEMPDEARRTTAIRATAGIMATDELKAVVFRKTGDYRVILRAAGTPDRSRTIKVRELQFRPVGQPAPQSSSR
jgi:hypothetical protein